MILDIFRAKPAHETTYCVIKDIGGKPEAICNVDRETAIRLAKEQGVCVIEYDVRKGVAEPICGDELKSILKVRA